MFVACVLRNLCLGYVIALSGLSAGTAGLVCLECLLAEDLGSAESHSLQAATLVHPPSSIDRLSHRRSRSHVVFRKTWMRCHQQGPPSGHFLAGHQLPNGLNAPLLN